MVLALGSKVHPDFVALFTLNIDEGPQPKGEVPPTPFTNTATAKGWTQAAVPRLSYYTLHAPTQKGGGKARPWAGNRCPEARSPPFSLSRLRAPGV